MQRFGLPLPSPLSLRSCREGALLSCQYPTRSALMRSVPALIRPVDLARGAPLRFARLERAYMIEDLSKLRVVSRVRHDRMANHSATALARRCSTTVPSASICAVLM